MRKTITLLIAFALFVVKTTQGQQTYKISPDVIASSGGDGIYNGNSRVTWTLGETIIGLGSYSSNENHPVTEGFNQAFPNEIWEVAEEQTVSTQNMNVSDSEINLYPNPTENILYLDISGTRTTANFAVMLTDINGKLCREFIAQQGKQTLDMNGISSGAYFITVSGSENNFLKSFKIIKK